MSKQHGLGANLYVGAYNLSGDTGSLDTIGGGPAALDLTAIDQLAYDRLGGVKDGRMDWTSFFNKAAGRAHPVLSALPRTSVVTSYCHRATLGAEAASMVGKQVNYDPTRGNDGTLTMKINAQVSDGFPLEWGRLLTAGVRTDVAATNGATVDDGVLTGTTLFGLSAYLHVFAFTGTSATIKIQDSTNDSVWADVPAATFGAQTAIGASRVQSAATEAVDRYLRVITTGTFTVCNFAVTVHRRRTAAE